MDSQNIANGLGAIFSLVFYIVVWASGGIAGYFIARKRKAPIWIGVVPGLVGGPCVGPILAWILCGRYGDGQDINTRGAGRSFGVDENPDFTDKS